VLSPFFQQVKDSWRLWSTQASNPAVGYPLPVSTVIPWSNHNDYFVGTGAGAAAAGAGATEPHDPPQTSSQTGSQQLFFLNQECFGLAHGSQTGSQTGSHFGAHLTGSQHLTVSQTGSQQLFFLKKECFGLAHGSQTGSQQSAGAAHASQPPA
jgi:hypothetical protein